MWGHGDKRPLPQGRQPRSDPDEPVDLNASAAERKRRWAPAIGAAGVLRSTAWANTRHLEKSTSSPGELCKATPLLRFDLIAEPSNTAQMDKRRSRLTRQLLTVPREDKEMLSHIPKRIRYLLAVSVGLLSTAGILAGTTSLAFGTSAACACAATEEEEAGLSITPNPLVLTTKSNNEEPITLAAAGAAGDEVEIITGGVGAITVTEGPAEWIKLKGANCAGRVLTVGGATCVEKMQDVKFPKVGETFKAEYKISWKSIRPASIILHTTPVKLKAQG